MPDLLQIYSVPENLQEREKIYIQVREKENRLYSDDTVKSLPELNVNHFLYSEWKIRTDSYHKLEKYINNKGRILQILDLGCGNGWMTNKIGSNENINIIGLDVNREELEQGARVFNDNKNLKFIYGDIFNEILNLPTFDLIVCASSIQYFSDLNILTKRLLDLLNNRGEIHIIDSPFYDESNVADARKRSYEYYKKLGIENMTSNYFHHTWSELSNYPYKLIGDSIISRFKMKLFRNRSLNFPWIIIYKD
jgi:SAM-dependent methyltransferase